MTHAIVSVHPEHVESIVAGHKTVEVRSRRMHLSAGTLLWLYATLPVGAIRAVSRVKGVTYMSSTDAWNVFCGSMALAREEFKSYVNGSRCVSVIELSSVVLLANPMSLESIRERARSYQPPQFFHKVGIGTPIYRILKRSYPRFFRNAA